MPSASRLFAASFLCAAGLHAENVGGALRPDSAPSSRAATASAPATAALPAAPPAEKFGVPVARLQPLLDKPLFKFTEAEVGLYLKYLHAAEPDLRARIVHLARKNIGQPYEIYLLGELPFETYDPQPIYCLGKSDCLVFTEHTYAMALTSDWSGFMRMLQRIRYRDGHLGVATRNHYTEADWNISNRWLVRDLTTELAGDRAAKFEEKIDRSKFLLKQFGVTASIPVEEHHDTFIALADLALALPHLQDGDFVNVVRCSVSPGSHPNAEVYGGNAWVGHTGLIAHGPDGTVHFIHSSEPAVREEPIADFIARSVKAGAAPGAKQRLLGFKFLRLESDPLANLRKLDGDQIADVSFVGKGCAISQASASLMTTMVKGKTRADAEVLIERFRELVMGKSADPAALGRLAAFGGVSRFPARVKCASLAWHALKAALADDPEVTTE